MVHAVGTNPDLHIMKQPGVLQLPLSRILLFCNLSPPLKDCQVSLIIVAADRAFFRPQEDLRRVGERFTGDLALIISARPPYRPLAGLGCSKPQIFSRAKKCSYPGPNNEGCPRAARGLLASHCD